MKLKIEKMPCPYCGGTGVVDGRSGHYDDPGWTDCPECEGRGWVYEFEERGRKDKQEDS